MKSQVRRVSLATWRLHFAGVDIEVISHASALVAVCAMGSPSRGHSRDRRPIAAANYIDAKRSPDYGSEPWISIPIVAAAGDDCESDDEDEGPMVDDHPAPPTPPVEVSLGRDCSVSTSRRTDKRWGPAWNGRCQGRQ